MRFRFTRRFSGATAAQNVVYAICIDFSFRNKTWADKFRFSATEIVPSNRFNLLAL
jgi:hypothetical protein